MPSQMARPQALMSDDRGGSDEAGRFHCPETVSEAARAALAAYTAEPSPWPEVDDQDAWKALRAETEEMSRARSAEAADRSRVSIRRSELGGVSVLDIRPEGWVRSGQVIVYAHGGAYTLGSAESSLSASAPMAASTGMRVVSLDYTPAPFAKWRKITDQVVAVIRGLVEEGCPLGEMAVCGDSAGGGLVAGCVLKMRDAGLDMPAAVVLWSPWSDLSETGDTWGTLREHDPIIGRSSLAGSAAAYADPADQRHPYVSPVYGDYSRGFPPTLIQVGTKEVTLSDAVRHYQALDAAGVDVKLDVYEGMWHRFQYYNWDLPESDIARTKMAKFLGKHIGRAGSA
eukprot:evm.model.scf_2497EXC.3 EVM.evm.TU.scf_2497EXC.3   scf_2497EXC:18344-19369(+)